MTITQKRAKLLREWVLSIHANNGYYYWETKVTGVPDGENFESLLNDIEHGEYDEFLDEMLRTYESAKKRYGSDGYYVYYQKGKGKFGRVINSEDRALAAAGYKNLPDKIYKKR